MIMKCIILPSPHAEENKMPKMPNFKDCTPQPESRNKSHIGIHTHKFKTTVFNISMKAISLLYVDKLHHENSEIGSIHLILRGKILCSVFWARPYQSTLVPTPGVTSFTSPGRPRALCKWCLLSVTPHRKDRQMPARHNKGSNDLKKLPFAQTRYYLFPQFNLRSHQHWGH